MTLMPCARPYLVEAFDTLPASGPRCIHACSMPSSAHSRIVPSLCDRPPSRAGLIERLLAVVEDVDLPVGQSEVELDVADVRVLEDGVRHVSIALV
jgi:hypothetical protein